MKALAKSPSDRYQSARELHRALQSVDLDARSAALDGRRTPRRRRAVAAALLVVPLLGWLAWSAVDTGLGRASVPLDDSRVVVFPLEGNDTSAARADEQLRRALNRWEDLALVDRFAVREALGGSTLTVQRARSITRQLGAGRFIRGSVSGNGFGAEVRVALYDVDGGNSTLAEGMTRLPGEGTASDAAFDQLADRLMVRQPIPIGAALPLGTRVLAAAEDYLRGREAVTRWALDSAAAAFDRAWRRDNSFGHAALWLALTRYWLNEPTGTWRIAAQAAARDSASLDSREMGAARALLAELDGNLGAACSSWQALTQGAPFDFWSWYSSAVCLDTDKHVVVDPSTPSGWRFRSSYHTALLHYLRAFELMPSIHRALHDNSFERVRSLLFVSANVMRGGGTADGAHYFLASPQLQGDTLVFIPYSMDQVGSADPGASLPSPEATARTTRRQRQLFREIATSWVASYPASLDAREALALALQLLGDPAALDTLAHAVSLAATPVERIRLAGTEAWIRLHFAVPHDHQSLRRVRALADSALRMASGESDLRSYTSLAALTGRLGRVLELSSGTRNSLAYSIPADIAEAANVLQVLAAFGVSGDTIVRQARRVEELVADAIPSGQRWQVRQMALARAATLAWPGVALPLPEGPGGEPDYLLAAIAADTRGDSAAMRQSLAALRALRRQVPPSSVSPDALLTEATLLSRHGHAAEAAAWLDNAMSALRTATPDFDPINAAALVRAMALRAELARELGDRDGARRWAGAVVELWADADPLLQPLVERMRILAM